MSLLARLRLNPVAQRREPPQGWRGGMRLAFDVVVTGLLVSVVLSLAVVGVAAQAAGLPLASPVGAGGDAYAPALFAAGLGALAVSTWLLRPRAPARHASAGSAAEILEQRVRLAGWVC